jgi:hypothetical protein
MIQQLITKSPKIVCKGKIYLAVRGLLLLIFSQETLCRWDVGWRMVDVGWWMWDGGCGMAAMEAAHPAGPPPQTTTSNFPSTGMSRAGS